MKREFWKMKITYIKEYEGMMFSLYHGEEIVHSELLRRNEMCFLGDKKDYRKVYDFLFESLGVKREVTLTNDAQVVDFLSMLPQGYTYMEDDIVKSFIRRVKTERLLEFVDEKAAEITI